MAFSALAVLSVTALSGGQSNAETKPLPDWWRPGEATANATLSVQEVSRKAADPAFGGGRSVTIRWAASGFPKGKTYELWNRWLAGLTAPIITDLRVGETGDLEIPDPKQPERAFRLGDVAFNLGKFANGEPISYAIVSTDRSVKAFAEFVPFPIEARQGTCRLSLKLISPDGTAFSVRGDGFEPNEKVTTVSRSDGEMVPGTLRTLSDGSLPYVALLPAAVSRRYKASYTVASKSCTVTVDYEWGPPALKKQ